ncbi:ChbG/HpnK family deacetylase [Dielma fastidiosa]|uniref:Putative glycoside hydrolase/deacetylase ChbG (UPF0249 family) n=1 Tax=Dielma fastidiosa TaxID=1034346 RepID=A0A318L0K5_9FIRM|nr:ChbG/HpnK family deacetylase [Dielma fastidiosa]PXX79073.1 putative glycoside hydrolase/deacetylase ChbG (UPF0249 family) [Dielma fastidiosa]
MKLIIRGDDFGYSKAFNAGYYKCIRNGIMTSAELMIGMPGTLEAVKMLEEFPWLPVGWHVHVCGRPSADASKVPHLLDENGNLCLHISRGHPQNEELASELAIELRAELETFIRYRKKKPDIISNIDDQNDIYSRTLRELAYEYHIDHLYKSLKEGTAVYRKWIQSEKGWKLEEYPIHIIPTKQKWSELNQIKDYNPIESVFMANDELLCRKEGAALIVLHPGYLDNYILEESTCNIARVRDCDALLNKTTFDHLKKLNVELITSSDYLYGTNDYQNWLAVRKNKIND